MIRCQGAAGIWRLENNLINPAGGDGFFLLITLSDFYCANEFIPEKKMKVPQNWRTEQYKGRDVHVTALPHGDTKKWDFTVRVTDPGADSSSLSELAAGSGDDDDFPDEEAAVQAGFVKGYALVDNLTN